MVNQVECHPEHSDPKLRARCKAEHIVFEAWSPLAQGQFAQVEMLNDLADKYGKTAAQMVLRWDLQSDIVTIPKSLTPSRIKENADLFDFEISPEDMDAINALDQAKRVGTHPDEITF
jgi:diketogulonate reductase-like aldo/keto reductase